MGVRRRANKGSEQRSWDSRQCGTPSDRIIVGRPVLKIHEHDEMSIWVQSFPLKGADGRTQTLLRTKTQVSSLGRSQPLTRAGGNPNKKRGEDHVSRLMIYRTTPNTSYRASHIILHLLQASEGLVRLHGERVPRHHPLVLSVGDGYEPACLYVFTNATAESITSGGRRQTQGHKKYSRCKPGCIVMWQTGGSTVVGHTRTRNSGRDQPRRSM